MSIFSESRGITLKNYNSIPNLIVVIMYCCIIIISFYYCNRQVEERKSEILKEYYAIILNHSLIKIDSLLQQLPLDQKGLNTNISIDKTDIQNCYKKQCIKCNIFEFSSTIDKCIPHFIFYKVEINKQLLYSNYKISDYELEKIFYINDYNQLAISLSIDVDHWNKIKIKIIRSHLFTIISSTIFLLLFIVSNKLLNKYIKRFYFLYYKNHYNLDIKKITTDYQHELKNKEDLLMKKIWDLEYSYEKEAELNCLFSQEVHKISVNMKNTIYINFSNQNRFSHYTIPLYWGNEKLENINIKNLIEIFSGIFSKSTDNISFVITGSEQTVDFISRVALYQIIYSIISYIIFILKEQSYTFQYSIRMNIASKKSIRLLIEYDGVQLNNEEDVRRFSNKFFKKRGNPFLLSINQVFSILRADKFNCTLGHNGRNFIEISKIICTTSFTKTKSNIMKFPIKNE